MLLQTLVSYFEFVCKFDDFVNIYLKTALSVDLCKTKRIRHKRFSCFKTLIQTLVCFWIIITSF